MAHMRKHISIFTMSITITVNCDKCKSSDIISIEIENFKHITIILEENGYYNCQTCKAVYCQDCYGFFTTGGTFRTYDCTKEYEITAVTHRDN